MLGEAPTAPTCVDARPRTRRARRLVHDRRLHPLRARRGRRAPHPTGRRSRSARRAQYPLVGLRGRTAPRAGRESCSARASSRTRGRRLPRPRPAGEIEPVAVEGLVHEGAGELEDLLHLEGERYAAIYNIDGCSWAYEMRSTSRARRLRVERVLVGQGELEGGILHGLTSRRRAARSRSRTAPRPTRRSSGSSGRTRARADEEDAASARSASRPSSSPPARTRPSSPTTGSASRRGSTSRHPSSVRGAAPARVLRPRRPQSQERPNFAWFSMPRPSLALEGFAVFVPTRAARPATGSST